MFEFILSLILAPITIGFLIISALFCEYNERHGWTVIFTAILTYIGYKIFQLTPSQLGMVLGGYIPVGFLWSFWRWKRRCDSVVEKTEEKLKDIKDLYSYGAMREAKLDECRRKAILAITPSEQLDTLVFWVIGWPFSFIEMFLHNLVNLIECTIRAIATKTYQKITAKATARIDGLMPKEEPEMQMLVEPKEHTPNKQIHLTNTVMVNV